MTVTTPGTSSTKEIVVLGGSYAGVSIAHYLLKHVMPSLADASSYHLTLVSTSSHFMGRPAAPRSVASEKLMPDEKIFLPIETGFKQYGSKMTFIQGTASAMDSTARTITVTSPTGETTTLNYYSLVLATGTKPASPLLGLQTDHIAVSEAWKKFRAALPSAKSIVIAGGGPSGVETAGELAELLNGKPGMFQNKIENPKVAITLVTGADKLLPILRPAIAEKAETLLESFGVKIIKNTRIGSVAPSHAGAVSDVGDGITSNAAVTLSNGQTLEADLYIRATGVTPNSQFIPKDMLTEKGYVNVDASTLRVVSGGERVYALGDVGSYTRGGIMDIYDAVPVLATNIKRDLKFVDGQAVTGQDRPYKPNMKETQIVPIGQSKGVGAIFGWQLPSFAVYLIKGRDYFASNSPAVVGGQKWEKESKWALDS